MRQKSSEQWLASWQRRAKEIGFAAVAAPLATPFVIAAAGTIVARERVSPFIMQTRYGRAGKPVRIVKPQTMPPGVEETASDGHNDERRTPTGRVISALRVDEGFELWNVLLGGMSIVGPRPLVMSHHNALFNESTLSPGKLAQVDEAYRIARPGCFDPMFIDMMVNDVEDTPEARADSLLRYVFADASPKRDNQIILETLDILKDIARNRGVEPTHHEAAPVLEPEQ